MLASVFLILPAFKVLPWTPFFAQKWYWFYSSNLIDLFGGVYASDFLRNHVELAHFWSLSVEEHFYLVWPLLVFFLPKKTLKKVACGCVVLALAMRIGLQASGHAPGGFTLSRIDSLAMGGLVAIVSRQPGGLNWLWRVSRVAVLVTLPLVLLIITLPRRLDGGLLEIVKFSVVAVFFSGVLVHALCPAGSKALQWLLNTRVLRFFGKYAYGLYVFHHLLLPDFRRWFPAPQWAKALGSPVLAVACYMLLALAISVALAILSWNLYEKQGLKLKRFFEYRRSSPKHARELQGSDLVVTTA